MKILDRLSRRERIILYVSAAVIILSLSHNFLIEPVFKRYTNIDREIGLVKMKLEKSLSVIKEKEAIEREYIEYAQRLKPQGSDEQEITYILNNLEVLSRNASVRIVNMSPKPPQEKEFYKRFIVELDTESDMSSLMKFIYDVKNSPILLKIDRLNLNTKTSQAGTMIKASMVISRISLK